MKCREANDFHHAHDALLAAEIGRFIQKRHSGMYTNPIGYTQVMKRFIKNESDAVRKGHEPGTSPFVISSFMTSGFDEETGELFKDDWSASYEVAKLKSYFNYRQCFISRMPEETSGAFWDQTVYSPRDTKKNMALPLKKGLDPKKYGSYSREQYAYFFIYKAFKKGKQVLEFAPVPVSVAAEVKQDSNALCVFANRLAEEAGFEFVEIVRPKIYKYQLIEMDGSRLYLTGKKEARNGVQFALNVRETVIAQAVFGGKCDDISALDDLFLVVVESLSKYSPKLFSALKIDEWKDKFFALDANQRQDVLKVLFSIGGAKANVADLESVGESKYAGQIHPTYSKVLNATGITFVDQSITGMFERRTHVGL